MTDPEPLYAVLRPVSPSRSAFAIFDVTTDRAEADSTAANIDGRVAVIGHLLPLPNE